VRVRDLMESLDGARGAHEETAAALASATSREETTSDELKRTTEKCAEIENGRRSARSALAEMASQNARLVSAFSAKKEEMRVIRLELDRAKKVAESATEGLDKQLAATQKEAASLRELLSRRDSELAQADLALKEAKSAARAAARETEKLRDVTARWERQNNRNASDVKTITEAKEESQLAARVAHKELEVERAQFAAERLRWEAERKRWTMELAAWKEAARKAGAVPTAREAREAPPPPRDRVPPVVPNPNPRQNPQYRDPYRQTAKPAGESASMPSSPTRPSASNANASKAMSPLRKASVFAAKAAAAASASGSRSAPTSPVKNKPASYASRHGGGGATGSGTTRPSSAMPSAKDGTPRQRAEIHKVKGNNEFHAKRFEAALAQYSAGLALEFHDDGFRAILHANRAAALQAMGLYCDAVMDCCASNLLDPKYLRALQRRADAYLSMGDWPNACRDLETLAPSMGAECAAKLSEARRKVKKGAVLDHYAVLGLAQSASGAEVKQAYRQLALKHHPDKAPKPELRDVAEGLFKHIAQAYAVLSDVSQRKRYDSSLVMARFKRSGIY
jgi:hypothetical protein